ncbi:hypothetical protein HYV81_01585 [Candidatus Woesearchaeota archaeon]|nr:hypothetical protein [Candidatus Woesearchaeota archaeon]
MKYMLYILCFTIIILAGCSASQSPSAAAVAAPQCKAPEIMVAGECCTDADANSICDIYESREPENISLEEPAPVEAPQELKQPEKQANLSIKDVQEIMSDTFSTNKTLYSFKVMDRGNVTDFENLFEVYESSPTRIYIWQIKKPHNYLYYYNNFTEFMKRNFDLDVRNYNVLSKELIDYNKLYEGDWIDANYSYEPEMEEKEVKGKKVIFESHLILFYRYDNAMGGYIFPVASVWCTANTVIRLYPQKSSDLAIYSSRVEDAKRTLERDMFAYRKGLLADAEKAAAAC